MTSLAWLIAFWLPARGAPGAQGLLAPPLLDFAKLARPASPNTALAAPAWFRPAREIVMPTYQVLASRPYAAIGQVAAAQPRTYPSATYPDRLQDDWVARSALFNFSDLVTAQVDSAGCNAATLLLYSRSVYGYPALGANRRRVQAWLAALDRALNPAKER